MLFVIKCLSMLTIYPLVGQENNTASHTQIEIHSYVDSFFGAFFLLKDMISFEVQLLLPER